MSFLINTSKMNKCTGCFTCASVCAAINHDNHSITHSAIKIFSPADNALVYSAVVCSGCDKPLCSEVCPAGALERRPSGGVLLNSEKCFGCRRCIPVCPEKAIGFDAEKKKPIICSHCGVCTTFCLNESIVMTKTGEVNNE